MDIRTVVAGDVSQGPVWFQTGSVCKRSRNCDAHRTRSKIRRVIVRPGRTRRCGMKNKETKTVCEDMSDLGIIDHAWDGFTIRGGIIWTPGRYPLRPGDLNCVQIRLQQIANYEYELRTPKQLLL